MCIGIPGQIVAVGDDIHQFATAEVNGVKREVNISLICEGEPQDMLGQWVLIHVGFAMALIDEQQAHETMQALAQLDEAQQI